MKESPASLGRHHVFVVAHYVLVLLRGPPEALGAELAAVRVVLGVDGDDVSFEARSVSSAVITVLALIDPPLSRALSTHHLFYHSSATQC